MVISVRSGATKHSTGSPGNQSIHQSFSPLKHKNYFSVKKQKQKQSKNVLCRFAHSHSHIKNRRRKAAAVAAQKKGKTHQYIPYDRLTLFFFRPSTKSHSLSSSLPPRCAVCYSTTPPHEKKSFCCEQKKKNEKFEENHKHTHKRHQ